MGIYEDRGSTLDEAKANCLVELDVWYGGKALDTFDCSVLGSPYRYYCAEADQLRMVNGKVSGIAMPLMCGAIGASGDPVFEWLQHTSEQCGLVHTAYVQFSNNVAAQYTTYRQQILSATTLSELDTIFSAIVYGV